MPTAPYQNSSQALGVPNYPEGQDPEYVSLGAGGRIVLRFTDNSLTGSGNNALDLWIFEIGPDVEDTFVDISKDGSTWRGVGKVFGATSGIDIDAVGAISSALPVTIPEPGALALLGIGLLGFAARRRTAC